MGHFVSRKPSRTDAVSSRVSQPAWSGAADVLAAWQTKQLRCPPKDGEQVTQVPSQRFPWKLGGSSGGRAAR